MGFQILNSEGQAISINTLDLEAREFWHKDTQNWVYEKHPKAYAVPKTVTKDMKSIDEARIITSGNWFDVIGYSIHSCESRYYTFGNTLTWNSLKESIADIHINSLKILSYFDGIEKFTTDEEFSKFENSAKPKELLIELAGTYLFTKPYFDLIDYWDGSGYKPKKV